MDIANKKKIRMKMAADKLAAVVITVAGVTVILAMAAMLALIVREAAPLFMPASQEAGGAIALPSGVSPEDAVVLRTDADLYNRARVAGVILRDGRAGTAVFGAEKNADFSFARLPGAPETGDIVAVDASGGDGFSLLWRDGTVTLHSLTAGFSVVRAGNTVDVGRTNAAPEFKKIAEGKVPVADGPPRFAMMRGDEGNNRLVALYADGTVWESRLEPAKGLMARGKSVQTERTVRLRKGGEILSAALNDNGILYAGTSEGDILSADLSGTGGDARVDVTPVFRDRRAIDALGFLSGGYALAVGDAEGGVEVWFPRREDGEFRLRQSAAWEASGAPVTAFVPAGRDRAFIALDGAGGMRWLYSTTGENLLDFPADGSPAVALSLNQRGDALATLHSDGTVAFRRLDSSYPEAGFTGFFRALLYEGYDRAAHVWQSTVSGDGEPKFSLIPLIWGSVKAALYALFFATPLALAAAMYLSQFAHPVWRARLKPAVEMLAAVPSVVVGFLAALWLAPILERHLRFIVGNMHYDQRNSLVIAIAMGFAVIPIIFSLAEDAISSVPASLSAASLALGASKWQTVMRVVLPTASPGIFTAVMLGFGRAVGETMIVLMAAGNTPIISLSPFDGMRTLSANIAVEMPEAPVGGTLYRTLFLCALLLFILTLVVNTVAEVFRERLRRRYGRV